MNLTRLEAALLPYEKKLRAQESLRRYLGVKEVSKPTYQQYIIGPIERFDRRKNAFSLVVPDNPFGEELRQRFKKSTGRDSWGALSYAEQGPLELVERIGQRLTVAAWRLCWEYHPEIVKSTPHEGQVELNNKAEMTRLIKKAALLFGADMVRITEINPRWIYQDIEIPHKYAIVVVVPHARNLNDTAPSYFSGLAVADAYSQLQSIATRLADFICGLGYEAATRETLGTSGKAEMLMVPMAIDAGVGEFARNGVVLSPEFGVNMRLKAITTDLPLELDKPISFGVHKFCMACENCATYCPANAIPFGPPTATTLDVYNNPGFEKWYSDAERCLTFWAKNRRRWSTCGGRCISVCPWNKPVSTFHNMVRWVAIHSPSTIKKSLVWGDKMAYQRKQSLKET